MNIKQNLNINNKKSTNVMFGEINKIENNINNDNFNINIINKIGNNINKLIMKIIDKRILLLFLN